MSATPTVVAAGDVLVQVVHVAGLDEAGRGALAGPVCAAAVVLDRRRRLRGLDDSKVLSAAQREHLAAKIRVRALAWSVAFADVAEVDSLNVLQASLLAMRRAFDALTLRPHKALVDGPHPPPLGIETRAVIDGDAIHPCIMAASILAKVERDAFMVRLDERFPGYGFARHKGYGTPEHQAALSRLGPCAEHRRTFAPVAQLSLFPVARPGAGTDPAG